MSYDVIIVGGGCAGLSAAVRLTARGARVLVLEARPRLGGRATAIDDRETGERVDNGQHVLLGCYHDTFAFFRQIGAEDAVRVQRQLQVTMVDGDGVVSRLDCTGLPAPFHLMAGIFDWAPMTWADRWAILRMATPIRIARDQARGRTERLPASPGETVDNWLIRNGQTPRLRELLWDPLALAALNQSPFTAAAPVFARVLGEMFTSDPRDAAIALPTRPLDELYAEPSRHFIEQHGGEVRTSTPARIGISGGHVAQVTANGERFQAAHVIGAVPWYALPDLFDGDLAPLAATIDAARKTEASPIVTVNIWFDRQVMDLPFIGLPGRRMQWVFDKRAIQGGTASHLALVSSGAADVLQQTNDDLIQTALDEIRDALPGARAAEVRHAAVVREPRATFSLAPNAPPRPRTATNVAGLWLAGDWVDTGLPATIEGAVRSGHWAADAVMTASPQIARGAVEAPHGGH